MAYQGTAYQGAQSFLYPHASSDRLSLQSVIQSSDADYPNHAHQLQVNPNQQLHLPVEQVWASQPSTNTHSSWAHHQQVQGTPAHNHGSTSLPQHSVSNSLMNEGTSYTQLCGTSTLQPSFLPPQQQDPQQPLNAYIHHQMQQGRSLSSCQDSSQSESQSWQLLQQQRQEALSSFDLAPLMRSHPEGQWHSNQQSLGPASSQTHGPHIIRMAAATAPRVPTGRHIDFRNTSGALGVLQLPNAYGMRPAAGSDVYAAVAQAPAISGSQYSRPQGHRPPKLGTVATYNPATGIRSSEPIGSQVTMISSGVLGAGRAISNASSPATSSCQVASPFGGLSQAQVQLQLQQQQQQHLQVQQRQQTVSSIGLQQLQAGQLRQQQQVTNQIGIQLQQQHAQQQRQLLHQQQHLHAQQQYQQGMYTSQQSATHSADGQQGLIPLNAASSAGSSSSASVDGQHMLFTSPNSAGQQHVHNANWSDLQNAHSMARMLVQNAQQQRSTPVTKLAATVPQHLLPGDGNSSSGSSPQQQQQRLWQMQGSVPGSIKPQHMNGPHMMTHGPRGPAVAATLGSSILDMDPRTSHHSAPQLQLPPGTAKLIARSNMRGAGAPLFDLRGASLLSQGMCSSTGWSANNDSSESAESSASQASEVQQLLQRIYPTASHQQLLAILAQQGLGMSSSNAEQLHPHSQTSSQSQQEFGFHMMSQSNSRSQQDLGCIHEGALMQRESSRSCFLKDMEGSNSALEDRSPMGPPAESRQEQALGSLRPQIGSAGSYPGFTTLPGGADVDRSQLLLSRGTNSSVNSSVSGSVGSSGWAAQLQSAGISQPFAAVEHQNAAIVQAGVAAAVTARALNTSSGNSDGGMGVGGAGLDSKDDDVELDVLLSCIGSELARNGITVQEATAAGWLGDLTTYSVSTLLASFQNELQRIDRSSSGNVDSSSLVAQPASATVGAGAAAIAIPQRVPGSNSSGDLGIALGRATAANTSAASSSHSREIRGGSLPSQAGGSITSGPLSSRFGFAAPSASREGAQDSDSDDGPAHPGMDADLLDIPTASFENLFIGSAFR